MFFDCIRPGQARRHLLAILLVFFPFPVLGQTESYLRNFRTGDEQSDPTNSTTGTARGGRRGPGLNILDVGDDNGAGVEGADGWSLEENAGTGAWKNTYKRTEPLNEHQFIYIGQFPGDSGRWLMLADTATKIQGRLLIRATLERICSVPNGPPPFASKKWTIREFPNATAVQNEMKFFELTRACHRIKKRMQDSSFLELLQGSVEFHYGLSKGVVKAAWGVVRTLLEVGWEISPVKWINKGQRELVVLVAKWAGSSKADEHVPPDLDTLLKNAGIKGEDMMTPKSAVHVARSIDKWLSSDFSEDPSGTMATMFWVGPMLKIVNADSVEGAGQEVGELAFDVALVVLTVVDLGATAPAVAMRVGQGFKTVLELGKAMFQSGKASVIALGRGSWGKIRTVPYLFKSAKPLKELPVGTTARAAEATAQPLELAAIEGTATKSVSELATAVQEGKVALVVKPELPPPAPRATPKEPRNARPPAEEAAPVEAVEAAEAAPKPWGKFERGKPRIEDGDVQKGWKHIDERHVTGNAKKGAGDLFAPGTTRAELEKVAETVVQKGQRVSEPDKIHQVFEKRMTVNGWSDRILVKVDTRNGTVVTMYPVRGGK